MRPHLIMFCYGVFIIGTLMSLAASGRWFQSGEISVINQLAGFSIVEVEAMGGWAIPKNLISFFSAFVTVITWNYPYLQNDAGLIFKMVFLYPVTVGVIITFVQLAAQVIQGIAGTIRSLLPG